MLEPVARERRAAYVAARRIALPAIALVALAPVGCRRALLHAIRAPSPAAPQEAIEGRAPIFAPDEFEARVAGVTSEPALIGPRWVVCRVTTARPFDYVIGSSVAVESAGGSVRRAAVSPSRRDPHSLVVSLRLPADTEPFAVGDRVVVRFLHEGDADAAFRPCVSEVSPFTPDGPR